MSRTRRTLHEGDVIITTPCCGAWPIRQSWLRTCRVCDRDLCVVCAQTLVGDLLMVV